MKKGLTLTFFASTIFLIFFASIFFKGKTLSTTAITPQTFAKGVFDYRGSIMKTLPLKDPGAFSWHHYPLMQLNNYAYKNGELPLWNPYLGSGQPLVADQQSDGFSPLHLPLIISPSLLVWDLYMIFRLLVAFIFTYLLAKRFGFNQRASFLSGIVFAFTGYFWFFITMNHLSIEVLIPAAFYFCERLIQKADLKNLAGLALIYGLALLGGMPESSFLLIFVSSLYFVIRSIIQAKKRGKKLFLTRTAYWLIAVAIGFAISAVLLLPLHEYLQNAWHAHGGGAIAGIRRIPYRGLADLFVPNFSWPGANWTNINRHYVFNYVGVLPLLLAFLAKKRKWPNVFFVFLALFFILKIVGFPVINQIGNLPVFKSIYYPKYLSPYFAISIAVLAGSTVNSIKEINFKKVGLFFGIWLIIVGFILVFFWQPIGAANALTTVLIRVLKPFAILVSFVLVLFLLRKRFIRSQLAVILIIALIATELFAYLPNDRSNRHNPQKKANFVQYLDKRQKQGKDVSRIIAFDKLLFPNTAAIFRLNDVRFLDALLINRYRNFMQAFMDRISGGHITGSENIDLSSRLLDLTNTKYVISSDPILDQATSDFIKASKPKPLSEKKGGSLMAILEGGRKYHYELAVPLSSKGISFEVMSSSKSKIKISVNNKTITQEIGTTWQPAEISAKSRGARPLSFTFEADSQIKIKNLMYESRVGNRINRFKLIYNKDVLIYENTRVLPRAFVAYDYKELKSSNSALDALSSNRFDLSKTIFLEEKLTKGFEKRYVDYTAAKVRQSGLNSLTIKVSNPHNGLLFLADNFYPGWKAFVNGKPSKIYRADYTYRAVFVPKGKNRIKFIYQPASLKRGFTLTFFGIIALILILIIGLFRERKKLN